MIASLVVLTTWFVNASGLGESDATGADEDVPVPLTAKETD